jgi:hypothetical protein
MKNWWHFLAFPQFSVKELERKAVSQFAERGIYAASASPCKPTLKRAEARVPGAGCACGQGGRELPLESHDFVMQSACMDNNWAAENLQTIRTLMERSALYRRALAPIMLLAGIAGLVAMGIGLECHLDSARDFGGLWLGTALIVVIGALLITRREALKDGETFWSPPTRRVAQALAPPLVAGFVLGAGLAFAPGMEALNITLLLPFLWAFLYGCALHSAGFFMHRGVKCFGWILVVLSGAILLFVFWQHPAIDYRSHCLMGFFFGVLHLLYSGYLYLTEKKNPVA